jgi:isoleucyl-tRNA synthetase
MASEGSLVVLDTQLDSTLIQEGLVREVVRRINDWRRAAGFAVDDRISVSYLASSGLASAIEQHREFICREVLATEIAAGMLGNGAFQAEAHFSDQWLQVQLARRHT